MKITGFGDQAISVRLDKLQLLGQLPEDVDVVRTLPDVKVPEDNSWYPDRAHFQPRTLYLRIQHRYCMRRPPGSALCVEKIEDFLMRYQYIKATDVE